MLKTAYQLSANEVLKQLESSPEGLTQDQVEKLREKHGENKFAERERTTALEVFISQFKSPLVYILLIAGIITIFLGEITDAIVICGAILLDIAVGFFQEYKATSALEELFSRILLKTTVVRDGRKHEINSTQLVPGDVVILNLGDKVPADGRIFKAINLEVDEHALTGESLPQLKNTEKIRGKAGVGDRENMVFMGTAIVNGSCRFIVAMTGEETELGAISKHIREEKREKTFLQDELDRLARTIGTLLVVATAIVFVIGLTRGHEFGRIFSESVALAVAALPESLPVAVTVIFAIGMQRILKKRGLVQKLLATETLGRTEVLCIDKTATLTEGKMEVTDIYFLGESFRLEEVKKKKSKFVEELGIAATLCNEAYFEEGKEEYRGKPTDVALLKLGEDLGFKREKIEKKNKVLDQFPFDQKLKFSANLLDAKGHNQLYIVGAPEVVLDYSSKIYDPESDKEKTISEKDIEKVHRQIERLGSEGYRVVAAGYKDVSEKYKKLKGNYREFVFLGLIVISDPLRAEAADTVALAAKAGLRLVIVTGDHANTAKTIAKKVGMPCEKCDLVTGDELAEMSDDELDERIETIHVFARVTPSDKVRIVKSWKRRDKVVAMTGDGINDAPALNLADIGVALGSGTEVAKEASDLVLLDDNLKTILDAIREGRGILDNIKKVVTYLLSDSFAEIGIVGFAVLFGFPLPILPAQILWVNLVEDGLPDVALALDPTEKDVMEVSPQSYKRKIIDSEVRTIITLIGVLGNLSLIGVFLFFYFAGNDLKYIQTMVFGALAFDSLFFAYSCKSLRKPIWRIPILDNKLLNVSFVLGIVLLASALYFPPLQTLLGTVPIGLKEWGILLVVAMVDVFIIELVKEIFIHRKYWKVKIT